MIRKGFEVNDNSCRREKNLVCLKFCFAKVFNISVPCLTFMKKGIKVNDSFQYKSKCSEASFQ